MTKAEFLQSKEYADMVEKIKGYKKGFVFTLYYGNIPKAKANALEIVTSNCIKDGILEVTRLGYTLQGELVEKEYRRK